MPQYVLRDIPDDLWKRFTDQANADGYPLHVVILQLLDDYATKRVRPGGPPPPLQAYAFLRAPFLRVLLNSPAHYGLPVRDRWALLRQAVEGESGADSTEVRTMDAVAATDRAAILKWLERHHVRYTDQTAADLES